MGMSAGGVTAKQMQWKYYTYISIITPNVCNENC